MSLIEKIIARAQANRQRIVLPEAEEERTLIAADKALADKLAPVFFGNRELVAEFLGRIKGAKPTDVTAEVNRLLKERKVSDISCNKVLWEILHDNGFYTPTLSNWNSQIR